MGSSKSRLPFAGGSVLGSLLETLERAGCDPLVVVVRPGQELPGDAGARRGVRRTVNPAPERGMLSSILCGLEELGGAATIAAAGRPLVLCPGDHPALTAATVRSLLGAVAAGAGLAVPVHAGRRGHPLVVAAALVAEIPRLDPGHGLRQLLARRPEALREVAVDDPGTVADLDTPEDYERLTTGR